MYLGTQDKDFFPADLTENLTLSKPLDLIALKLTGRSFSTIYQKSNRRNRNPV